jgi:hypothetical protein
VSYGGGSINWKHDFERGLSAARARKGNAMLDISAAPM